jgi:hypothetical protein
LIERLNIQLAALIIDSLLSLLNLNMELKVEIGFEQLLKVINQLPAAKIIQLKAELSGKSRNSESPTYTGYFQNFLLSGPVMDDHQYENYKEVRTRLNK